MSKFYLKLDDLIAIHNKAIEVAAKSPSLADKNENGFQVGVTHKDKNYKVDIIRDVVDTDNWLNGEIHEA